MCQGKMVFNMMNYGDALPDDLLSDGESQVGIKFGVPRNIGHDSRAGDRCKDTTIHLSCLAPK